MPRASIKISLVLVCAAPLLVLAQPAPPGDATYRGRPASFYIERLEDEDPEVRRRAVYALGKIGRSSPRVLESLESALEDGQMEVRWYAVDALGRLGPEAAEAVPAIVKSLQSKLNDETVRRRGARALGRVGPPAKDAVTVLREALASDDLLYRVAAAEALWQIARDRQAIDTLIDVLGGDSPEASFAAALALGEIKSRRPEAVAALVAALGHPDADVRHAAVHALAEIGPPAVGPLSVALEKAGGIRHEDAATALGQIFESLRREVLYNDAVSQREFATAAAPLVRTALPALARHLSSPQAQVQDAAALAIAKAGSIGVPQLLRVLTGGDAAARGAAAEALVRLEAYLPRQRPLPRNIALVHRRIMDPLNEVLNQRDKQVQRAAVRLFVALEIGPEGRDAAPLLRRALQSEDLATRRYADKALARLELDGADD